MKCYKCKSEIPDESKFCMMCGAKQTKKKGKRTRGNGQGSVYQRGNKTWIAIKVVGYKADKDGNVRRITKSKSGFKTKKEAVEYLPFLTQSKREKTITFKQLYETWFPNHQASKSTMDCYSSAMKYYEPIWYTKIPDITVDDLQECIDDCPKGKRTRENMKTLCGLLYKYAIPRNLAELNMGEYVKARGGENGKKDGLPIEAVEKIAKNVGKVKGADYVLCQCYLGFRPAEFLSLDAKNYNRKERAFVGGAKTDAGKNRVVTISPKIQPIIDGLMENKISGPVFCADGGKKMGIAAYRSLFYDVLDKCGIDNPVVEKDGDKRRKYTPHSCRHTFATLMKRVEGSDKDKLELIGHTSTEMLRHYQDTPFEDLRRITDAI